MDTDDLSKEAYKAVIMEAEKFNHDLTLSFGMLASLCDDEAEYLTEAKKLVKKIGKYPNYQLEDMFFGVIPDKGELRACLDKMLTNISEVEKIPEDKRHFDS